MVGPENGIPQDDAGCTCEHRVPAFLAGLAGKIHILKVPLILRSRTSICHAPGTELAWPLHCVHTTHIGPFAPLATNLTSDGLSFETSISEWIGVVRKIGQILNRHRPFCSGAAETQIQSSLAQALQKLTLFSKKFGFHLPKGHGETGWGDKPDVAPAQDDQTFAHP